MKLRVNNLVRGLLALAVLVPMGAWAMPLGSSARTVIPSDIQQIISVDYRMLKNSDTAMALKAQLLPDNLKQFESALRGVGINPEQDLDTLVFAAYRTPKQGIKVVGIAQGSFSATMVLKKIRLRKIRPAKYRENDLYSMPGGMQMTFLDENTLLFGELTALRGALDTRDGDMAALDSNGQVADMMGSVDSGMVWSVLDQEGTQNMLRSALGDAAKLADYETVKKRVLGSSYIMNFADGIKFDLSVAHVGLNHGDHAFLIVESGHPVSQDDSVSRGEDGNAGCDRGFRQLESADALPERRQGIPVADALAAVRRRVPLGRCGLFLRFSGAVRPSRFFFAQPSLPLVGRGLTPGNLGVRLAVMHDAAATYAPFPILTGATSVESLPTKPGCRSPWCVC